MDGMLFRGNELQNGRECFLTYRYVLRLYKYIYIGKKKTVLRKGVSDWPPSTRLDSIQPLGFSFRQPLRRRAPLHASALPIDVGNIDDRIPSISLPSSILSHLHHSARL